MKKNLLSWIGLGLIITLIGGLYASFFDTEDSKANIFTAGTLELILENVAISGSTEAMNPGDEVVLTFSAVNTGTLPFEYQARASTDGDLDGVLVSDGSKGSLDVGERENLTVRVKLPGRTPGTYEGKQGTLNLVVRAWNAGVDDEDIYTFPVSTDAQPPSISVTSPQAGGVLNGKVLFEGTARDKFAVAEVRLYVDDMLVESKPGSDSDNRYTFEWNSGTVTNGGHTLTLEAVDASGQTSAANIQVQVEN
ncbi:MAG: hypothetical protein GX495_08660 [Chloroflexi bacterium]|nr:hypothetical protein [Chloroflexota bacterium]